MNVCENMPGMKNREDRVVRNAFSKGMLCFLITAVVVLAAGCPGGGKKEPGKVTGWVCDGAGNMIPLVHVTLSNGLETYTDTHGLFSFDQVAAGAWLLEFAYDGYATTSRAVTVKSNKLTTVTQQMGEAADKTIASAQAGGAVADADGNTLVLPANALSKSGAKAVTGSVHVEITAIDPGTPDDMDLFAGSFALNAQATGENAQLEAYAAANFEVTQDGEDVILEGGATAEMRLVLPPDTDLQPGDVVAAWHYDSAAGHWDASGQGTVEELQDGTLVVVIEVSVFGWWSCGALIEEPHCITGTVSDSAGEPVEGAGVVALGLDYLGVFATVTDADGAYRVYVKPNAQVRLDLVPGGGYYVADSATVATGAPGECTSRDLEITYDSCISGYVKEEDGTPIEGEQVFSSTGGTATTDAAGYFCMPAPGNAYCLVYVFGRPPRVVATPETAACGDAGLEPVLLTVDYPEDGDMIGLIVDNTVALTKWLNTHRYHTAAAMFCSGFDGDKFDALMPDVLEDRCEVHTASIALTPQNTLSAYLGIALGPQALNLIFDAQFEINGLFHTLDPGADDPENVAVENEEDAEGGRIGPLDAGVPGQIVTPAGTLEMRRPFDVLFGDGKFGTLGFYLQYPVVSTICEYGDTVAYSFPGGVDLGAFEVSGVIPDPLVLTAPASVKTIFEPVDGQLQDLPVTWETGDNPGDYVTLLLETVVLDSEADTLSFGLASCTLIDDGAYTISAAVLAQLPHLTQAEKDLITTKAQVNYLFIMRHGLVEAAVPLLRGDGGNGRAMLVTNSDPDMAYSVAVDFQINLP